MSLFGWRTFADAAERRQHHNDPRHIVNKACSLQRRREMFSNVQRPASSFESGLIEFICVSHGPEEDGPTVTPLRVGWGYCPGAGGARHAWRQIEPTAREHLERYALKGKGLPPGSRL